MLRPIVSRVGRVWVLVSFFVACGSLAAASEVLFPQPRHFVRRVEDPLAGSAVTLDEYCAGNQVVTVNGSRVAIADYAKQELIEIDRSAGTWSLTRFDEIAKSRQTVGRPTNTHWTTTARGARRAESGRSLAAFELDAPGKHIDIGIDANVLLSEPAVEVLVGAAYPNVRTDEHSAILEVVRSARPQQPRINTMSSTSSAHASSSSSAQTVEATGVPLPAEQTFTYENRGEKVVVRNVVVSVSEERVTPDVLLIPPGAKQVESRITRVARELRSLDENPSAPSTTNSSATSNH